MMHSLDEQEDDDSSNIVVPLVANNDTDGSSTAGADSALRKRRQRNKQRLHSLEIALRAQEEEDSATTTCLGDSWRFVASVLLASVMIAPLLLKHYRSSSTLPWPSDLLPCAQDLHISYSATWEKMRKVTDYCIESRPSCDCTSPLVPKAAVSESQLTEWNRAFHRNVDLVKNASTDEPDVVLLGDSITEHWQGTSMGRMKYPDIHKVYQSLFRDKPKNGITGLALGISGDRCPQVLYRLQNGEMPTSLGPRVWWLLIGTNDLESGECTPESVLVGIINLVKEISTHNPETIVVINSILPRSGDGSGKLFGNLWNDIVWINERMECYVQAVDRVEFYNATSLFLKNDDQQYINETLMPDMLHPSAGGSQVWGTEIVKRVKELVKI
jgi:lysophospholipase L1-like esterase